MSKYEFLGKVEKVAKHLLLGHTCDNCELIYKKSNVHNYCDERIKKPKEGVCQFWYGYK